MLLSLLVPRVIWYTVLQCEAIFSHCIAVAGREDFCATAVSQPFNILSPLGGGGSGGKSFFISSSEDAHQIAWHNFFFLHTLILKS